MNPLLERIARLYAPLGQRGLLMDGHYRFAPDASVGKAAPGTSALARDPGPDKASSRASALLQRKPHAY